MARQYPTKRDLVSNEPEKSTWGFVVMVVLTVAIVAVTAWGAYCYFNGGKP